MFKYRAISFPLLLLILGVIIYSNTVGPWLFTILAVLMMGFLMRDFCAMLANAGVKTYVKTLSFSAALFTLYYCFVFLGIIYQNLFVLNYASLLFSGMIGVLFLGVLISWAVILCSKNNENKLEKIKKIAISYGVFLLGTFPYLLLIASYFGPQLPEVGPLPHNAGARQLLYLALVTKAMDTGGYIFGMLSSKWMKNGNHKILPGISPKKSWEGTLGGLLFSVGVSLIMYHIYSGTPFCQMTFLGNSLSWYIVSGIILGLGSFAGDLTESALKRVCQVKDSGNYIPGMGGVFDVLDSFIYNGFLFWILALIRW